MKFIDAKRKVMSKQKLLRMKFDTNVKVEQCDLLWICVYVGI